MVLALPKFNNPLKTLPQFWLIYKSCSLLFQVRMEKIYLNFSTITPDTYKHFLYSYFCSCSSQLLCGTAQTCNSYKNAHTENWFSTILLAFFWLIESDNKEQLHFYWNTRATSTRLICICHKISWITGGQDFKCKFFAYGVLHYLCFLMKASY